MTEPLNAALRDYAERLLTGTGLCGADAEAVAAGQQLDVPARAAATAAAMREGWAVAAHTAKAGGSMDVQP